jgi:branched-chain amino acid transport system permease protein
VVHSTQGLTTLFVALVYGGAAVGVDYYSGLSGELLLGNFAFVAIGAYAVPVLNQHAGLTPWAAAVAAPVVCAAIAGIIGVPLTRLAGLGSVFVTFFFGFLVQALISGQTLIRFFGGENGVGVPALTIGATKLALNPQADYYATVIVVAVIVCVLTVLANRRPGQNLRLIKSNVAAAAITGVRVPRARVSAFALSAAAAGLVGVLYGQFVGYVTPDSFGGQESITLFAMVAVGGMGTLTGPLLGAVGYELLNTYGPGSGESSQIIFAAILLVALIAFPRGIYGGLADLGGAVGRLLPEIRPQLPARFAGRWARQVVPAVPGEPAPADTARADVAPGEPDHAHAPVRRQQTGTAAVGAALQVRDVSVSYSGERALSGVSLDVRAGQIVAIIGPNGAGKTTLLNCISRIQPVASGRLLLDGADITGVRPARLHAVGVARTFQHPALALDLSAVENVDVGIHGQSARRRASRRAAARRALALTGLDPQRFAVQASDLSLGEQKLVDIARSLAGSPRLILMDEPTAGLDESEIGTVAACITRLRDSGGVSVVVIAHHVGFVRRIADYAYVLNLGTVFAQGQPEALVGDQMVGEVFFGVSRE